MPDTVNNDPINTPETIISTDMVDTMTSLFLSGVLDTLSDTVIGCVDGRVCHINATGVKHLDATDKNELMGLNIGQIIQEGEKPACDEILQQLARKTAPTPITLTTLKGTTFSKMMLISPMPDLGQNAYILTVQNLTDEAILSKAVQDSEDRFATLVDNALDFICVLSDDVITYINQAGLTLLKATLPEEVVGSSLNTFLHRDYKGVLDGSLHELANSCELLPLRFADIHQNPIDVEVGIIILEDGDTPRYMIEARDITAHNHAVTALRHSIENLEQRVKDRTKELSEEIVERQRAEEMLRHTASHDGLTDLPNRSLLMDRLNQATSRTRRDAKKCAVLFIDLDGFKPVNDRLGHDMGDVVLKNVADRLTKSIRETDTAARFGGDEFVLVLTDLNNADDAIVVAKKVLKELSEPITLGKTDAHIGASIGIAFFPDDGDDAQTILKQADNAMYKVKKRGKNSYTLASDIS